ncbi:hypothetical protein, partial [Desulfobacca acetoxidans]
VFLFRGTQRSIKTESWRLLTIMFLLLTAHGSLFLYKFSCSEEHNEAEVVRFAQHDAQVSSFTPASITPVRMNAVIIGKGNYRPAADF